jgi:hypothetical protein
VAQGISRSATKMWKPPLPPRRSTRIWATLHTQVEHGGEPKSKGTMGSSRLESTLEETKTEDLERCAGKLF